MIFRLGAGKINVNAMSRAVNDVNDMSSSKGQDLVDLLRRLGSPGADNLHGEDLDWIGEGLAGCGLGLSVQQLSTATTHGCSHLQDGVLHVAPSRAERR